MEKSLHVLFDLLSVFDRWLPAPLACTNGRTNDGAFPPGETLANILAFIARTSGAEVVGSTTPSNLSVYFFPDKARSPAAVHVHDAGLATSCLKGCLGAMTADTAVC